MSEQAIADVILEYGRAAAAARDIGFDAVEIHAAHGFLLDQFFWAETNVRTDYWGGSTIEERSRFPVAVIQEVRRAVGPDFPLSVRISQWKEQAYDACLARNAEEMRAWLWPLVGAGADVFSCSQRRWWEPQFRGSPKNFAGWVRDVTKKPTITVGSVGLDGEVMAFFRGDTVRPVAVDAIAQRLRSGEFDLVAVGRALLADPQGVAKIQHGTYRDILPFNKNVTTTVY